MLQPASKVMILAGQCKGVFRRGQIGNVANLPRQFGRNDLVGVQIEDPIGGCLIESETLVDVQVVGVRAVENEAGVPARNPYRVVGAFAIHVYDLIRPAGTLQRRAELAAVVVTDGGDRDGGLTHGEGHRRANVASHANRVWGSRRNATGMPGRRAESYRAKRAATRCEPWARPFVPPCWKSLGYFRAVSPLTRR